MIPNDAPEYPKTNIKPAVPVTQVCMASCVDNEVRFINETCENFSCLQGNYANCYKSHQIIRRKISPLAVNVENLDLNVSEKTEDETELIYSPAKEFDEDFQCQNSSNVNIEIDDQIELSDCEDENWDPRILNSDPAYKELKDFVLQFQTTVPDIKKYFSSDLTLNSLQVNNLSHELFIRKVSTVLSNRRAFGPHGLYLADFDSLIGHEWLTDAVIDAMFAVIQNKCLSLGHQVVSIPVGWYFMFKVSQILFN